MAIKKRNKLFNVLIKTIVGTSLRALCTKWRNFVNKKSEFIHLFLLASIILSKRKSATTGREGKCDN
jgi:hypothetical protein